jgi:hypothetical protein
VQPQMPYLPGSGFFKVELPYHAVCIGEPVCTDWHVRKKSRDDLRTRLRKMTDDDLLRFGKAARFMCRDKIPRQVFSLRWAR